MPIQILPTCMFNGMKPIYVDPFCSYKLANTEIFQSSLRHDIHRVAATIRSLRDGPLRRRQGNTQSPVVFCITGGVGLTGYRALTALPRCPGADHANRTQLLEMDGGKHTISRAIVEGALGAAAIKSIIGESLDFTQHPMPSLMDRDQFRMVEDLVIPAVLHAFPNAYGIK